MRLPDERVELFGAMRTVRVETLEFNDVSWSYEKVCWRTKSKWMTRGGLDDALNIVLETESHDPVGCR